MHLNKFKIVSVPIIAVLSFIKVKDRCVPTAICKHNRFLIKDRRMFYGAVHCKRQAEHTQ